jgi:CelD/BcsL family acetyltransferase involved in cellulose biosynthesis
MGLQDALRLDSSTGIAFARVSREDARGARPRSDLRIEVLDRAAALLRLSSELEDLASRALESNLFAEAPVFLAGLEHMDLEKPLWIVCVRDGSGQLHAVFPFALEPLRAGVGPRVLRNWTHHNCSLGTPLIDATRAAEALIALADWIKTDAAPAGGIRWTKLSWDGPFGALVRETAARRAWLMDVTTARRAVLLHDQNLKAAISSKHAKELRRLERRLADEGELAYEALQADEAFERWFEDFLAVEAKGWKGAEGSAIGLRPQDTAFFRSVAHQAHAAGRLQLLRLRVGGRIVAMKLNVRAAEASYALKIGYDEAYARFSPGVLLELFNIKEFEKAPPSVRLMDSCAVTNHPMIDRLWRGRREIATVTLARRGLLLRALVWGLPRARALRAAWARRSQMEVRP